MYNCAITKSSTNRVKKERIHQKALRLWREIGCNFMDIYEDVYIAETHNLANTNFGFTKI